MDNTRAAIRQARGPLLILLLCVLAALAMQRDRDANRTDHHSIPADGGKQ